MPFRHRLPPLALLDFLCVLAGGLLAYLARASEIVADDRYALVVLLAGFITVTTFSFSRVYLAPAAGAIEGLRRLFSPLLIAGLLITGVGYLSKSSEHFSRIWAVLWFALSLAAMVGLRAWLASLSRTSRWRRWLSRRVVLVGRPEDLARCEALFESPGAPWLSIVGRCDPAAHAIEGGSPDRFSGSLPALVDWAREHGVDDIIVVPPEPADAGTLLAWLSALTLAPSNVHVGPSPLLQAYPDAERIDLGGVPMLNTMRHPLTGANSWLKRIMDTALASLILIGLAPLMALIALLIRLDSPGPVIFRQQRYGFHNQRFTVLKFRTMRVDPEDDGGVQARAGDPRVTRVGRWLRRFSLDELPQLVNVLDGSMSLVGPRPHAVPHNDQFASRIDRYLERHKVRPGMTGWAQVHGLRGETDTLEKMNARIEHDLFYVKNWSPLLDLEILLRTSVIVLTGRNAC